MERSLAMRPLAVFALLVSVLVLSGSSAEAAPGAAARDTSASRDAPRLAFAALIALSFGCLLLRRRGVTEDARERR